MIEYKSNNLHIFYNNDNEVLNVCYIFVTEILNVTIRTINNSIIYKKNTSKKNYSNGKLMKTAFIIVH